MLRIRLSRVGKRKQPAYRLVVTDSRHPRESAHKEIVGHYNPLTNPPTLTLKDERIIHWLHVGAQPSDTAAKILTKAGIMEQAGRAPVVHQGKEVPPGRRGKRGDKIPAEAAPAPAPAAAAPAATAVAEAPAEAPAAEPEAAAPEPEAEATAEVTEPTE